MMKKPEFKLELKETRGAMFETKPRYDVLLNGSKVNELYYNMTGYVGGLPTPTGMNMVLRESGISAWKRELGRINREAKELLAAVELGAKADHIFPTSNPDILFVAGIRPGSDELVTSYVARAPMRVVSERFAGTDHEKRVPIGLLHVSDDHPRPMVIASSLEHWVLRASPATPVEIVAAKDFEQWERSIDELISTTSKTTMIAVSRNADGEPNLHFVDAWAAQVRMSQFKSETKLSDMTPGEPAPVADAEMGRRLQDMCPWFDPWAGQPEPETEADVTAEPTF